MELVKANLSTSFSQGYSFLIPGCSHYYSLYGTDASVPVHIVLSAVRDNDCTQNGRTQKSPAFFAFVPVLDKYGILRLCSLHIILCFLTLNIASLPLPECQRHAAGQSPAASSYILCQSHLLEPLSGTLCTRQCDIAVNTHIRDHM